MRRREDGETGRAYVEEYRLERSRGKQLRE